jgi:hypothetical protein
MTDIDATIARLQARWDAENEAFEREYAERHSGDQDDDTPTTEPVRKRRPLAFTKRDVARAIEAYMSAGLSVQRVEIEQGNIKIITGQPEPTSITPENEWDTVK